MTDSDMGPVAGFSVDLTETPPPAAPPGPDRSDTTLYGRDAAQDHRGWALYRKTALTRAKRITGPFRVVTRESTGPLNEPFEPFYCADGYLAIDSRGYPYAIAKAEFEAIYQPAPDLG